MDLDHAVDSAVEALFHAVHLVRKHLMPPHHQIQLVLNGIGKCCHPTGDQALDLFKIFAIHAPPPRQLWGSLKKVSLLIQFFVDEILG